MHSTAEHKKKAETATAAMAVPTESTQAAPSRDADCDSEESEDDTEDSAYNAFVAIMTDLEVGDDVPPERPMPQIREATPPGLEEFRVNINQDNHKHPVKDVCGQGR
jgi:hypothetical protein